MSSVVDKHGALKAGDSLLLDLGCGQRKRGAAYVGIDLIDGSDVDVVGDVVDVLRQLPPASVSGVYSSHFLEHVDDFESVLTELGRTMAPQARLDLIVPHFSNPYFYSDLTHRHAFGLYSLSYFLRDSPFKRKVPTYGRELPFRLEDVTLGFKAAPPFYGRYAVRRVAQAIFNCSRGMKEFYEDSCCYFVPCYELRFVLRRL